MGWGLPGIDMQNPDWIDGSLEQDRTQDGAREDRDGTAPPPPPNHPPFYRWDASFDPEDRRRRDLNAAPPPSQVNLKGHTATIYPFGAVVGSYKAPHEVLLALSLARTTAAASTEDLS